MLGIPTPFFVFLSCLFITYAIYLLVSRGSEAKRARLNQRLEEAIRSSAHSTDTDVQLAREELLSEIPWLNRVLLKLQASTKIKQMIDQADLQITVMLLLLFSLTAGVLAFFAVSMVTESYLLMAILGILAAVLPFAHVAMTRKKRLKKFLQLL